MFRPKYISTYFVTLISCVVLGTILFIFKPDMIHLTKVFLFISVIFTWISAVGLYFHAEAMTYHQYERPITWQRLTPVILWILSIVLSIVFIYTISHLNFNQHVILLVISYVYVIWFNLNIDWFRQILHT